MNENQRRRVARLTVAAVLVTGLVGCSSSDGDAPASSTSSTSTSGTSASTNGEALMASFEWDTEVDTSRPTLCVVESVSLRDTSTGAPTSWSWTFPDGSTSTEQDPTIDGEVAQAGDQEVTLEIESAEGERDEVTEELSFPIC